MRIDLVVKARHTIDKAAIGFAMQDALFDLGADGRAAAEHLFEPCGERRDVRAEQAGKFVLRADEMRGRVVPPAAALAVLCERHVHAVAQVGDVALECGGRDAQSF